MIETLTVFAGMCATLYVCFWLFEKITGRKRPQDARSIAADLGEAVAQGSIGIGEYHTPIASCGIEAGLCPETAEAISAMGEGVQGVLEAAGEGLGQVISGL